MTRSSGQKRLLLCALAAALAVPAAAAGDPSPGGAEAPAPPAIEGVISAQGPNVAIAARAGTMLRSVVRFRGTAPATWAGRTVSVERFDGTNGAWIAIATAAVAADGRYRARWRTDRVGEHRIRAVLPTAGDAVAAAASPELAITVHRPARATWYGPGLYGRMTTCGVRMTRTLLGVAHRRLPCGTPVAILYRGRRLTVPVVDRGPFRRDAGYDLTAAAADALGFRAADRLGAVRLRPR
jgi:peptidoglycan lytic transglycosylase